VKKWTVVDRALTPDGKPVLLYEHDGSYSISVDRAELMSTRRHASEEKIAELACAHLKGKRDARILIGGLGFGFTLKAALAMVPDDTSVTVVEMLAPVIQWNRNPAFPLAFHPLADPRVTVVQGDVFETIRQVRCGFDSMVLDVDNGPAALSTAGNSRLYDNAGLDLIRRALRPDGCVGFWSAAPDVAFEKRIARAGFRVDVHRCRANGRSGGWHTLFTGCV
jgi:spermidine synthase